MVGMGWSASVNAIANRKLSLQDLYPPAGEESGPATSLIVSYLPCFPSNLIAASKSAEWTEVEAPR